MDKVVRFDLHPRGRRVSIEERLRRCGEELVALADEARPLLARLDGITEAERTYAREMNRLLAGNGRAA